MAPTSQVLAEEMFWCSDLSYPQEQAEQMKRLQMQAQESRHMQELHQRRLQQLQARQQQRLQELQREQADKQLQLQLQLQQQQQQQQQQQRQSLQQPQPSGFEPVCDDDHDSHVTFGLDYKSNQEAILDLLNKLPCKTNASTKSSTPQTSPSMSPAYISLKLETPAFPALSGRGAALRAPPGLNSSLDEKFLFSKAPISPPPGNLNFNLSRNNSISSNNSSTINNNNTNLSSSKGWQQHRLQESFARPRPEEIEATIDTSNTGFWGIMTPATTTASCMTPEEGRSARGGDDGEVSSGSTDADMQALDLVPCRTTLMVRNIPVMYTQNELVEEWKAWGNFDFLYLPRTAAGKTNLSYAFINFSNDFEAEAFQAAWHKKRLTRYASRKALNVSFAEVQGLEANLMQLRKKRSRCPDATQCEPLVRIGGCFVSLPAALEAFA